VTVDNKYGFSPKGGLVQGGDDQQPSYGVSGRPVPPTGGGHQGIYGPGKPNQAHFFVYSKSMLSGDLIFPELPPRIDRASKPPNTLPTSTPGSSIPSRNSSSLLGTGGTLGRSAQERLFGGAKSSDEHDEYATRNQLLNAVDKRNSGGNSLERQHQQLQDSLDRQQQRNGVGNKIINNNGSYDSVSSYDSFNTTQMTAPNRLGPNAPDDLKSVPNAK
jgi:tight junction protein 1